MLSESAALPQRKRLKCFKNDLKTVEFLSPFLAINDYPAWLDVDGEGFDSGLIFLPFVHLWPFQRSFYHQCLNDYLGMKPWVFTTNAKQWFGKREKLCFASRSIFYTKHHFLLHWSISKQQLLSRSQGGTLQGGWSQVGEGEEKGILNWRQRSF